MVLGVVWKLLISNLELLSVIEVAPVDRHVLDQALTLPYRDLEDAVQMAAAGS